MNSFGMSLKTIISHTVNYMTKASAGLAVLAVLSHPPKNIIRELRAGLIFEKAYLWAFERMLEGRQFDKWKAKYDVMDWYVYGVQEQYRKLNEENDKLWQQNTFRAYENELYYGDYFDNLTHEYERRDVNTAIQILRGCQEKKEVSRIAC